MPETFAAGPLELAPDHPDADAYARLVPGVVVSVALEYPAEVDVTTPPEWKRTDLAPGALVLVRVLTDEEPTPWPTVELSEPAPVRWNLLLAGAGPLLRAR